MKKPGGGRASKPARRHGTAQNATTAAGKETAAEKALRERRALEERLGIGVLDEVDKGILGIVLQRPATTDREIGVLVGLSREAVNRRRNRPAFAKALQESQLDALTIIQSNQATAARTLGTLLADTDPRLRLSAASIHIQPLLRSAPKAGEDGAAALASFLADAAAWRKQAAK